MGISGRAGLPRIPHLLHPALPAHPVLTSSRTPAQVPPCLDRILPPDHTGGVNIWRLRKRSKTMRRVVRAILIIAAFLPIRRAFGQEPAISIHLDAYADRTTTAASPRLLSFPPAKWADRYRSESIVYLPGETAHITVELPETESPSNGEIAVLSRISGGTRIFHYGTLAPGTYGPYEVPIVADFEIYQVRVRSGVTIATKGFYGIRPYRGMKPFSDAMSSHQIFLSYRRPPGSRAFAETTPWDVSIKEGGVPLGAIDANWSLASFSDQSGDRDEEWWLWTHYACGMLGLDSDRTGLVWGPYNPSLRPVPVNVTPIKGLGRGDREFTMQFPAHLVARPTDTMLPNEIYLRERLQPMLRTWAENLSEKHPGDPLTIALGDRWDIAETLGRQYDVETLRFFVSWMKELFDITIEADTFSELIQKCEEYPNHLQYFVARNTTLRSLELTCEAVRDIVADSKAWDRTGLPIRTLIALPEAREFCGILSRCMALECRDDRAAFVSTDGNPLPHSLSAMVFKALAPEHNFSVGWTGCPSEASIGEIHRWYLDPAWITAYDGNGNLHHLYTHSPPTGEDNPWRSLAEYEHAPDETILAHDRCFQLMEAIAVDKPLGPLFVCKDWTFADDKSGTACRSDLYEDFLLSLRRHKVPVCCAVHLENESSVPKDLPRIHAPRMNGPDEIRFGFKAGSVEKWFACDASGIPDSLVADFASQLNAAGGNPVVFPADTSIEGYAFRAREMIFIVAEETAGREQRGRAEVVVGAGDWKVIDVLTARSLASRKHRDKVAFEVSLMPNSASLYCLIPGGG
jgi:hypothetical protein